MWVYPNNWIPTKSLEQMANTNYDVLIIGSGAGGGGNALPFMRNVEESRG